MKITIHDLARETGVSISTISNALNRKGKVSEETRNRILEMAKQMGYPFEEKQAVKRSKIKGKIGIVFPRHSNARDQNYYLSEVLAGAEEQIKASGYALMIESYSDYIPDLTKQELDGMMLIGGQFPESFIIKVSQCEFPLVTIGTYSTKVPIYSVIADNQMGAYQATSHLLKLGHRNIGLINGPETTNSTRSKYEGFREAMLEFGATIQSKWIMNAEFRFESGYEIAKTYLQSKDRPTALFIADDPIAIGAVKALQDAGLSVPEDMAVVGFGNSSTGKYISPALTTIAVYQRQLGVKGAIRLMDLIDRKIKGEAVKRHCRFVYSTDLVIRDSCGATRFHTNT